MNVRLISPSHHLEATYREFLADFEEKGEKRVPWVLSLASPTFQDLVDTLHDYAEGVDVAGFVANSTYWLVGNGDRLLGVSNLRHELTPSLMRDGGHIGFGVRPDERGQGYATQLLALTLVEAQRHGIDRALLTCEVQNFASARVIEKNGGVYESKSMSNEGIPLRRYWVHLGTC